MSEAIRTTNEPTSLFEKPAPLSVVEAPVEQDTREVSPFGNRLVEVAQRIQARLEKRAVNNAHAEALSDMRDAQDEAYDSYADNIAATKSRERREKVDEVKTILRGAGRRGLESLKNGGLLTLGAGMLAGEYTARKAKAGAESAVDGLSSARDAVIDTALNTRDSIVDKARDTRDSVLDKVTSVRDAASEKVTSLRERLVASKEAAKARIQERRAKWAAMKQEARTRAETTRDNTRERVEKIKWSARTTRTAGRVALLTFKDTRDALSNR